MNKQVPTINWRTGGSRGWAYGNNANRLKGELKGYRHVMDRTGHTDVAIYFDVHIHQKTGHIGDQNILRIGGPRPLKKRYGADQKKLLSELAKFDAIIALNPDLYRIGIQSNPNTFLVPNGLDLTKWKYLYQANNRRFVVGFAGNIKNNAERDLKGFDLVKEACGGSGLDLIYYLKSSKQIAHDRMLEDFYGKIDCLLHPVKAGKEGSSNVIMEALAAGVPVITTRDAGYHGAFLENGKNVLFCTREVNHIKETLQKLKKDTRLRTRLSREGRKFCEQHHDIKRIASIYKEIIEKRAGPGDWRPR